MNNEIARIIIVLLGGIWGIYQAYSSHFESSFFDLFELILSIIIILPIWLWAFYKHSEPESIEQKKQNRTAILVGGLSLIVMVSIYSYTSYQFNKPTLIKVFYDGDFNGTSIDFKTDGTFITDDFAVFVNTYSYGEYSIKGNELIIKRIEHKSILKSDFLQIKKLGLGMNDSIRNTKYLFQTNKTGLDIKNATKFRLVTDNR